MNPSLLDGKANGHALRSAETRARMLDAAIEVFGEVGFKAASTRQISQRADVSLAAIVYHFGGKRELYIATAQMIADHGRDRIADIVRRLAAEDHRDQADRIVEAVKVFARLVADTGTRSWTRFFARCEQDADEAFRIIHGALFAPFEHALAIAVAGVAGGTSGDEGIRTRVAILMAVVVSLRTHRNTLLRSLSWDHLDTGRLERVVAIIADLARSDTILATVGSPSRTTTPPER